MRRMEAMRYIRTDIFKVSQSEFSAIAGVSQATVSRWEKGDLTPGLTEMGRIRHEATQRGIAWEDAVFFEGPAHADADADAEPNP